MSVRNKARREQQSNKYVSKEWLIQVNVTPEEVKSRPASNPYLFYKIENALAACYSFFSSVTPFST